MVTEDYVSFETAKLLKEKGFDEKCTHYYKNEKYLTDLGYSHIHSYANSDLIDEFSAPTLQMAMKWLREEHNFHIDVFPYCEKKRVRYQVLIWTLPPKRTFRNLDDIYDCEYKSNEQACDAAIKWCLEKIV